MIVECRGSAPRQGLAMHQLDLTAQPRSLRLGARTLISLPSLSPSVPPSLPSSLPIQSFSFLTRSFLPSFSSPSLPSFLAPLSSQPLSVSPSLPSSLPIRSLSFLTFLSLPSIPSSLRPFLISNLLPHSLLSSQSPSIPSLPSSLPIQFLSFLTLPSSSTLSFTPSPPT